MKRLISRIKPASGFSSVIYVTLNILLPLVVFALVRMSFVTLALAVILLSKWRMFAVRVRFWPANIRANSVDIMVGVSLLLFMANTANPFVQFFWALLYIVWLLFIKPASAGIMIPLQALIGMSCALMALFSSWGDAKLIVLVGLTGLICYLAARHFFDSFDEPYARLLSYLWGYFGAAVVWVLGHWLLYYSIVAQPVLLLVAIGFGLAALYYLDHHDRLSGGVQRQITFIIIAVIAVVLIFSDWGDKII